MLISATQIQDNQSKRRNCLGVPLSNLLWRTRRRTPTAPFAIERACLFSARAPSGNLRPTFIFAVRFCAAVSPRTTQHNLPTFISITAALSATSMILYRRHWHNKKIWTLLLICTQIFATLATLCPSTKRVVLLLRAISVIYKYPLVQIFPCHKSSH